MGILPYYYNLSSSQLESLSLRVNIRQQNGDLRSKDIGWQEKISIEEAHDGLENDVEVALFTKTLEDGGAMMEDCAKFEADGRAALAERIRREGGEDPSKMIVMVRVDDSHDEILCVLKASQSGVVSACPALAEWHSFTRDQVSFDYSIEMMFSQEGDDTDRQNRSLIQDKRSQLLSCRDIDEANAFNYQTHVEIVSVTNFTQPNIILSAPFGSTLCIKYKLLNSGKRGGKEAVVLNGSTKKVQSYDFFLTSIQFLVRFIVAFICIGFAILHSLGKSIGRDISPAVLLAIIPLGLLCQFIVFGHKTTHHINHQFSLLFRRSSIGNDHPATISHHTAMVDMSVYFHHNFGLTSLAGRAVLPLPSEPGIYEFNVPAYKPIACYGMNERKCIMQSYYLGTCFGEAEVSPESLPTLSNDNGASAKRLLSQAGVITVGSGSIRLRVNVMKNYFNGSHSSDSNELESPQHHLKVQETVEEVLSRVRRNKRVRMSRRIVLPSSIHSANGNASNGRSRRSYHRVVSKEVGDDGDERETKQSE